MDVVLGVEELLNQILSFAVCNGGNYKNIRLVCITWYKLVGDRVDEFSNHLITLITKYPDKDWHWSNIMLRNDLPLNFILKYKDNDYLYKIKICHNKDM